jgi:hypothetical protein
MRSVKAAIVGGAVLVTTALAAVPATAAPTDDTPTASVATAADASASVVASVDASVFVNVALPGLFIGAVVTGPGIAVGLSLGH